MQTTTVLFCNQMGYRSYSGNKAWRQLTGMNGEANGDEPPDSKRRGKHRDRRSLGPVPNLEKYVKPDWWRGIFNNLYLKTDGDVVEDPRITASEIDRIIRILHLQPDDKILDLCCGQGRHTLELARRGYSAEGLDRSHYLIQRARSTAKKEGLQRSGSGREMHGGSHTATTPTT